jgi:hypothetical protein
MGDSSASDPAPPRTANASDVRTSMRCLRHDHCEAIQFRTHQEPPAVVGARAGTRIPRHSVRAMTPAPTDPLSEHMHHR